MLSEYEICAPVASEAASKADVSGLREPWFCRFVGMRRCENWIKERAFSSSFGPYTVVLYRDDDCDFSVGRDESFEEL